MPIQHSGSRRTNNHNEGEAKREWDQHKKVELHVGSEGHWRTAIASDATSSAQTILKKGKGAGHVAGYGHNLLIDVAAVC
jgi:hypothetical protein